MISGQPEAPCFVVMGRYGDLMILLPGWKAIFDSSGVRPIVVVSKEFACIFNGVSYVQPHVVPFHFYSGVRDAIKLAVATYGDCIVPKWWDDPRKRPPPIIPDPWFPCVTIRYGGKVWQLPKEDWESYMTSQWEHAGFTRQQMLDWPVVFDRRNEAAEAALRMKCFRTQKPKLLYNFSGVTSPVPSQHFKTLNTILSRLSARFELVELSSKRCEHIYDLLGLYDHAAALLTSDTATLHLAGASKLRYVALLANGGSGSVPRGNCILKVRYGKLAAHYQDIEHTLQSLA